MGPLQIDPQAQIDGYDLAAEKERYRFPDVTLGNRTLNRANAAVDVSGEMEAPAHEAIREEHLAELFVTTHDPASPVLELGYPVVGPYVGCHAGTYLDLMLGCAQKIIDENHPNFRAALRRLFQTGLLLRREINTDDFLTTGPTAEGVHTAQELAALLNRAARARFVSARGWRSFLCNSGTESIEAAIKLCCLVRWRRLTSSVDADVLARLMSELGIEGDVMGRDAGFGEEVWADYPMFLVSAEGGFHGRTLGALNMTWSRRAHQIGYPKLRWVRHIPYNGAPDALDAIIDPRPLGEILDAPGGVQGVLAAGKIPADLCAGVVLEGFQGEGGYVPGDKAYFGGVAATCRKHGILLVADEVQSMGRTGRLFSFEHLDVAPDVIAMAKAAFLGITLARAELAEHLHPGWHSNTWGGGKVFDVNMSYATFDALLNYDDPVFDGKSLIENIEIKGGYLMQLLEKVKQRHPDTFVGFDGRGGMIGLSVRNREDFVNVAWRHGVKVLGAGAGGDVARVRLLLLADVLTKEVEEIAVKLDEVFSAVESGAGATA